MSGWLPPSSHERSIFIYGNIYRTISCFFRLLLLPRCRSMIFPLSVISANTLPNTVSISWISHQNTLKIWRHKLNLHIKYSLQRRQFSLDLRQQKATQFPKIPETAPLLLSDHFCSLNIHDRSILFSTTDISLNPQPCQASPKEDRYPFFRSGRMLRSACRSGGGDQAS